MVEERWTGPAWRQNVWLPGCPLGGGFRGPGEVGVTRMGLYVALRARLGSEEGATAVEYALMVALIALVVVLAVTFLGQQTSAVYDNDTLKTALT
jgi:pilus assembly protein Flp/PilA